MMSAKGSWPLFYIALDEALSTPQKMSQHIYDKAVKKELRSYIVKMESEECTTLENYLLDCRLPRYPDRESIRHLFS